MNDGASVTRPVCLVMCVFSLLAITSNNQREFFVELDDMMIAKRVLAAALGLALLTACSPKSAEPEITADGKRVLVIGHSAPLTGPQSHLGKDNENGVRMAIAELNAQSISIAGHAVEFRLLSEDDQADPRLATAVAQKFVDDGVIAVIGHLNSGTTMPASRVYNAANIIQVSPSATTPSYTRQGFANAFRVMANDIQQGRVLGEVAVNDLSAQRIAVIDDRTAYGQGLADEFVKSVEASGGKVVVREYTNDKASDFTAILTKIKGESPDLLFYGGMDGQAAPMAKQIRALGLNVTMMGGDGMHTAEFMKLAGPAAEGVVSSLPGRPLNKLANAGAFIAQYEKRYGKVQLYAPYAYDATMLLVAAMRRADSLDPVKVQAEMKQTDHPGITANIRFDERGDLRDGVISVYRAKAGSWQLLRSVESH